MSSDEFPSQETVVPTNSSERDEVKQLLKYILSGSVLLLDRGYPGYELIRYLMRRFSGYFVFRCPAQSTFPAVQAFIVSGKEEDEICIDPSNRYIDKIPKKKRKELEALNLRVIRLVSPDGTVSVLLTNLLMIMSNSRRRRLLHSISDAGQSKTTTETRKLSWKSRHFRANPTIVSFKNSSQL